jgi:hypothetical protein
MGDETGRDRGELVHDLSADPGFGATPEVSSGVTLHFLDCILLHFCSP